MISTHIQASAYLAGQSIELRHLNKLHIIARDPTTIALKNNGYVTLFRFGAIVFFIVNDTSITEFIEQLTPNIVEPFQLSHSEKLKIQPIASRQIEIQGNTLFLEEADINHFKVIADFLAKTVFLDYYEQKTAGIFDRIEPLAAGMQSHAQIPRQAHGLIRHIGEMLKIQHHMVGRAQVGEKPDVLWEHPELEKLWHRLENEYEINERQLALERKLELISSTAETLLELLQDRRTLPVEWYIVILIVIEIFLTLYELFFRH